MSTHVERHGHMMTRQEGSDYSYRLARRITYYAVDAIEVFLGFRFVLLAFGANPDSPFVSFMYAISAPFAAPFLAIFPNTAAPGVALFEWSTLVAMVVYLLIGMGLVRLFRLIFKGGRPAVDDTIEP